MIGALIPQVKSRPGPWHSASDSASKKSRDDEPTAVLARATQHQGRRLGRRGECHHFGHVGGAKLPESDKSVAPSDRATHSAATYLERVSLF